MSKAVCPVCNAKLRETYILTKKITEEDHPRLPGGKLCPGVGKTGNNDNTREPTRAQQRIADGKAGTASREARQDGVSARNAGLYQTPLKNQDAQRQRVATAVAVGVPGHGSDNSNSNRNGGTTKKLNEVNGATGKRK